MFIGGEVFSGATDAPFQTPDGIAMCFPPANNGIDGARREVCLRSDRPRECAA